MALRRLQEAQRPQVGCSNRWRSRMVRSCLLPRPPSSVQRTHARTTNVLTLVGSRCKSAFCACHIQEPVFTSLLRQRAAARWLRAAGTCATRMELTALISHMLAPGWGSCGQLEQEWWEQAAGEVTAVGFKAALAALHNTFTSMETVADEAGFLRAVAFMVEKLLSALHAGAGSSQRAVACACTALLLSSAAQLSAAATAVQRAAHSAAFPP